MRKTFCAAIFAALIPAGSSAQVQPGADFGTFYLSAMRARSCIASQSACSSLDYFVMGFIGGVSQPMKLTCGLIKDGSDGNVDVATALGGTQDELLDAVIALGSTHPELHKADAGSGVMIALAKHRPCPFAKTKPWPNLSDGR